MKIHVQKVDPAKRRVSFDSEVGAAEAGWMGDLPQSGHDYQVELAVSDRLVWGDSIVETKPSPHLLTYNNAGITIVAKLESIDGEGAATLRLGPSLVLVETEGTPPPAGTQVRVRLGELFLADTGI